MESALLDALGYVGDALGKPGRAVRGLLAGRADEAAAAIPFSDALGLTDPGRAVSGRDLLDHYGLSTGNSLADSALGFGADVVTDPTTYLGGFLGRMAGKAAGRGLEAAAAARGPGYATTLADLMPAARAADDGGLAVRRLDWIGKHAPGAFGEVPEGSSLLGAGAEGVTFRTPAGDVVRLGREMADAPGRPVSANVLQSTRALDYGTGIPGAVVRAERVPLAETVGDASYWLRGSGRPGQTRLGALAHDAAAEGLNFADRTPANAGLVNGQSLVIDPGAVRATEQFAGGFQPVGTASQPSALTRAMLDLLGGQRATRRALDAGLTAPGYERGFGAAGALAGGGLGAN